MASARAPRRQRGEVETLPSGGLRVRVYAGVDPLTGKRLYLTESVPAGARAAKEAEKARVRLISQVDERKQPRTRATVNQLLDRYLEVLEVDATTQTRYESILRLHVRPALGDLPVPRLTGEIIDRLKGELRRCRDHCDGRSASEHRVIGGHDCTSNCRPHVCKPLSPASIREVHFCLSGALSRAVRWGWISVNPLDAAEPPGGVPNNPQPPTAEQAAAIVEAAFAIDLGWGVLVWLAMVTGARRGELCALRWESVDFERAVLAIRSSIAQEGTKTWEKDTKTHQQRRIALDRSTVALLRAYRGRCDDLAAFGGAALTASSRLFSKDPDFGSWLPPSSVTQRFIRMSARLGWSIHLHQLRHYSATELIAAGVDVRTVAGRLGHGGGGTTTLKAYAAWVSEADQRAAGHFDRHMPSMPIDLDDAAPIVSADVQTSRASSPYERIAADLRGAITSGVLTAGMLLPTVVQLMERYGVSAGTAQRAVAQLAEAGLVRVARGRRAVVS
ncbi:hypothetical protein Acsp06_40490 [Actinomycetospora sp. NBRC 106375]|uniref:tyrosine-type recombinase/integrase n=1 Tax=Actinomycetospora sp. NBRC 106375 TaxID=3032207 RepID=UPI0024A482E0|nr:tyrosine-type recombinase/integrase [Actinomycetospora sp. NBRC 106375]GLZ47864.1 hypothetical protein Acsp06_40490 [Actinomycetospora sp. NBRC 106375]